MLRVFTGGQSVMWACSTCVCGWPQLLRLQPSSVKVGVHCKSPCWHRLPDQTWWNVAQGRRHLKKNHKQLLPDRIFQKTRAKSLSIPSRLNTGRFWNVLGLSNTSQLGFLNPFMNFSDLIYLDMLKCPRFIETVEKKCETIFIEWYPIFILNTTLSMGGWTCKILRMYHWKPCNGYKQWARLKTLQHVGS